jgi:tripartite-type tricarboxylate transporter receptor subunit TctC
MKLLLTIAATAAMASVAVLSYAQSTSTGAGQPYPSRPVRYVVAFAAGDSPDIVARLVGDRLTRLWEHQVVVENRTGAGGTIAGTFVAKSAPDGHTLFHCNIASNAIALALYTKLPYDGRDFAPISRIGTTPNAIFVHPSLPVHSLQAFVAHAKASPGKISYGHGGVGASPHLTMELFKSLAHIDVVHVAYKGASPALADLLGGQIPSMISNVPASLPYVQSGKIRPLAVTGPKRVPQLASVPTMIESGYPGFIVTSWYGLCAPAGTPPTILDKIHADLVKVLQIPEIVQRFSDMVVEAAPQSRDEFAAFIRSEATRWAQVVKEAKIPTQ